jgi:hypothetical protein
MSFISTIVAVALVVIEAAAADIRPGDSDAPLFEIFEALPMQSERPKVTFELTQPLLVVSSVGELILARDNKGVLIRLNEKDAKIFAELTRKFEGRMLILKTSDDLFEVMRITAPIEDGYLGFKYPQQAAIAEYLRKRFRIAEFKEV